MLQVTRLGVTGSSEFVEAVRSAGDIVRLVSDYVPLKPSGTRLKGLCPFHQEKTPSFSVDPGSQLFYCFGCQTGGDIFKFVMLYEKVGFREALEMLAHRWGVPVPTTRPEENRRRRLLEMNQAAAAFYRRQLLDARTGKKCRDYLEHRGIDTELASNLELGYAPDSWDALRDHLLSKRFRPEQMIEAGLVLARKDGRGEYDRFRNRLVFPIRDVTGRTVAFGGRALDDTEPKYLNSPETPTYVKGSHLYGLDLAREAIRREGLAIIVEGYLDLAALLHAGFDNAVASLGTAFSPAQAQLLARYTNRVVVSYDGDTAGGAAAARSLDLLLGKGFQVQVVELPEKMDPDDLIRKQGAEAYGQLVSGAPGYLEFLVRREAKARDLDRVEERVAAVNAVLPHVARLSSSIERASMAGYLADTLHIEDELVLQELRSVLTSGRGRVRHPAADAGKEPREVEARLVSLLLRFEAGREIALHDLDPGDLDGTRVADIVGTILRLVKDGRDVDYTTLFSALERDEDRDLLTRIAFRNEPEGEVAEVEGCLCSLRRQRLVRERKKLQRQIQTIADPAAIDALLMETQQLARQIDALS